MKEAKLSSVLMERYDISEEDSHGKVLWHSLDENGHIDIYDMRFGDTIIRNLTESDILGEEGTHGKRDEHGKQAVTDRKRRKKRTK
jgi:hypothetical protein